MSGQQVGYTRVSSLDQNPDRQLDGVALNRTFTDSASGRSTARPQLEAMLAFVRDGDTSWPAISTTFAPWCAR
jgi:DNA invertase Pin-like site-specific DNA recombinase